MSWHDSIVIIDSDDTSVPFPDGRYTWRWNFTHNGTRYTHGGSGSYQECKSQARDAQAQWHDEHRHEPGLSDY